MIPFTFSTTALLVLLTVTNGVILWVIRKTEQVTSHQQFQQHFLHLMGYLFLMTVCTGAVLAILWLHFTGHFN